MNAFVISLLASMAIVCAGAAERKNWALLIAGSAGYENYRHQADVCHAYQILKKNGIPDEQIVVMMFDDIAHNEENPFPGNIINRPHGPNVYPGVPKDYTSSDVNAQTFLKVLQGDKEGIKRLTGKSGKVIDSGPDDYVFVYFADHGGPGILGMPSPPYLKARDLNNALKSMTSAKRYAKLTFYVEACYSGTMFDGLLATDTNIYVTTAANTHESSYAWYYDSTRNVYLGDLYSIAFLENDDNENIHKETLEKQYDMVKKRTNTSHVMQYGDKEFTSLTVDQFIADKTASLKASKFAAEGVPSSETAGEGVPAEFAGLRSLEGRLASTHPHFVARRASTQEKLRRQLWIRSETEVVVRTIAGHVLGGQDVEWTLEQRPAIHNWNCYEKAVDLLFELCPGMDPSVNDFVLTRMNVLVNLCNSRYHSIVMGAVERTVSEAPLCY